MEENQNWHTHHPAYGTIAGSDTGRQTEDMPPHPSKSMYVPFCVWNMDVNLE
jgi:hypothetical protein